ncbi:recombinase family protein [Kordia algicida OT-1]|uniref:Serine type site-specific recombinase n=1 Tax=Kordia algicida OT-1 TaxID=391587 RepID=A9DNY7_9FLAO|nr:recombinase family protein [Kordia algicida]EDP97315.1 serine type site-specific recombinase [Kordia algicida OT-1]
MSNLQDFQSFGKKSTKTVINNNKAVIYTRVSSGKQKENTSLETQREYCTLYAQRAKLEISAYFGGTNESAKNDDRKEYQKMLTFVRQKKISNIIVYSIDRFSRAGSTAITTVEKLQAKGINVISVTQPMDTKTSTGTFFQNLNLLFSKYDNDQRKEKTITGMKQRLLQGFYIGNAPIGFKNARDTQNRPILIHSDKAKFIRKAFQWKANESLSNVEIIRRLKNYGVNLSPPRLTDMFRNPVYCGLIANSLLEGKVVKGNHKPIVSKKLFLQVNNINAKKNGAGFKHKKNNPHLPLKGFITCDGCGKPITGYTEKIYKINYYRCNAKGCSGYSRADKLNDKFKNLLNSFQIDEKFIAPLKLQMKYTFEYHNESNKDIIAQLKYNLKAIKQKIETVEERFVYGEINMELYSKHNEKLKLEYQAIEKEIQNSTIEKSKFDLYVENSIKLLANLPTTWELSNCVVKQKLQNLLFPNGIRYNRQNDRYLSFEVNPILDITSKLSISYNKNKTSTNTTKSKKLHEVNLGENLEKFMRF